jgi:hypothetical protein
VSGLETVALWWTCERIVQSGPMATSLCGTSFALSHLRSFYDARACAARCPSCGATLTQREDGCELEVTT